jgi:hypothetical protein
MQPRRVTVCLDLWTDSPTEILKSPDQWVAVLAGKNPSFAGGDNKREPMVRVQSVTCGPPLGSKKAAPPAAKKKKSHHKKKVAVVTPPVVEDLEI